MVESELLSADMGPDARAQLSRCGRNNGTAQQSRSLTTTSDNSEYNGTFVEKRQKYAKTVWQSVPWTGLFLFVYCWVVVLSPPGVSGAITYPGDVNIGELFRAHMYI